MSHLARLVCLLTAVLAFAPIAQAAGWDRLLEPRELNALLAKDDPVLIDLRSPQAYAAGHVEGAVNVPYAAWRGPEDNPGQLVTEEKLTLILNQAGIEPGSGVVVTYQGRDASDFGAAARVYWTVKSAGVDQVAILNGGIERWTKAGLPLSTNEASNFASDTDYGFSDKWLADEELVRDVVEDRADAVLIDARPDDFFRGRAKHDAATWAGTLRRALNLDQVIWFHSAEDGHFDVEPEVIRARAKSAGWEPGQAIVSFCNTGHWAATNWFALSEIAGIEDVKLYPESMVGWTRNNDRTASR